MLMKLNPSTYIITGLGVIGVIAGFYFAASRNRFYFSSISSRNNKEAGQLSVANVNTSIRDNERVVRYVNNKLGVGQQVFIHRPDGKVVNQAPISRVQGRVVTLGIKFNAIDKKVRRSGGYLTVG
jgi:hypothetical protein